VKSGKIQEYKRPDSSLIRSSPSLQGNETAKCLEREDKEGTVPRDLYNHYTVIVYDQAGGTYSQVANAAYYKEAITAIVAAFDRWIAGKLNHLLPAQTPPLPHFTPSPRP